MTYFILLLLKHTQNTQPKTHKKKNDLIAKASAPISFSLAALEMSALGFGGFRVMGSHLAAAAEDSPMSAYKASARGAPGKRRPHLGGGLVCGFKGFVKRLDNSLFLKGWTISLVFKGW